MKTVIDANASVTRYACLNANLCKTSIEDFLKKKNRAIEIQTCDAGPGVTPEKN